MHAAKARRARTAMPTHTMSRSQHPYFVPVPDPLFDESLLFVDESLSAVLPVRSLRIATGVNDVVTWSRSSSCSVESTPVMLQLKFTPVELWVFDHTNVMNEVTSPVGLRKPKNCEVLNLPFSSIWTFTW